MNQEEYLTNLLTSIVEDIHKKVAASDLTKEEGAEKLKKEIQKLLKRFGGAVDDLVPELIINEYFGGFDEARKLLVDEAVDVAAGVAIGAGGVVAQEFREPVYMDSLNIIMAQTFLDLKAATRTAGESAVKTIDKVKDDIAKGTIQGQNRKAMTAQVMKTFRDDGLTSFITKPDKRGIRRRLPLDFYAKTVVRYKVREAANTGAIKRYEDAGQDLVMIYENSDTCEICGRFRNMVISLKGETEGFPVLGQNGIRVGPYHPNCRGSVRPFVVKRKTPEEIQAAKERNSEYRENEDTRTPAQKAAYDKEQEKRRKANAEKIQFMQYNQVLGAENYKTLGAFRNGKRTNSPKFQELQSAYRSKTAGKRKPPGGPGSPGTPRGPKPSGPDIGPNGLRNTDVIKTRIPQQMERKRRSDFENPDDYEAYRAARSKNFEDIEKAKLETIREIRERPQFLKTKADAKEWISKNYMKSNGKIDLDIDDIDIEITSLYCEVFDKVSADFPQLKNQFTRFGPIKDGSGGLMEATRGIGFGQTKLEGLVGYNTSNISSGYTVGRNIQDTMIHEMGHNLDDVLSYTGTAGQYNAFTVWQHEKMSVMRKDIPRARQASRNMDDAVINEYKGRLSEYAFTNEAEYFAEGFSAMYAGRTDKTDVPEFSSWIRKAAAMDSAGKNRLITDKEVVDAFDGKRIEGMEYP